MLTLHSKKLAMMWHLSNIEPNTKKHPIDGHFIFNSLFSVYAFSTQNNDHIPTLFAKKVCTKLGDELRAFRVQLKVKSQRFSEGMDDIELRPFVPRHEFKMNIDTTKLSPESTMLIKIFLAVDALLIKYNKALFDGELNSEQKRHYQHGTLTELHALLQSVNKTCLSYHRLRKSQK
ncbi:hypothetical protein [Aliivibrio fischeri]|uniref:hypothetical protein n=1 Tax=Aliivibrio fischeri TaxID=668 RepID=UPI00080E560C|nr:hypothetical protein [Aliivibrio fischeri]OCH48437.1 hypothetical protein A6E02_19430 [Aliivibrio fischeri]